MTAVYGWAHPLLGNFSNYCSLFPDFYLPSPKSKLWITAYLNQSLAYHCGLALVL